MESNALLDALPTSWRARLAGKTIVPVSAGMSGASVFRVTDGHRIDHYLKIATGALADPLTREIERTEWLALAGVRVPRILARFAEDSVVAVAMTPIAGQTADHVGDTNWRTEVMAVARALAHLHALALATCPFDERLNIRLARARELVRSGAIDAAGFDERNAAETSMLDWPHACRSMRIAP